MIIHFLYEYHDVPPEERINGAVCGAVDVIVTVAVINLLTGGAVG